ncbi:hypothetical protein PtB15_1B513 [Puccinia triticina]|nr:hypothetical protein PtB15_1B513 [Puccinia triticina]
MSSPAPSPSDYGVSQEPRQGPMHRDNEAPFGVATACNLRELHYVAPTTTSGITLFINYKLFAKVRYDDEDHHSYRSIETERHLTPVHISGQDMQAMEFPEFKARVMKAIRCQATNRYSLDILAVYADFRGLLTWNYGFTQGPVPQPVNIAMQPISCFSVFKYKSMDVCAGRRTYLLLEMDPASITLQPNAVMSLLRRSQMTTDNSCSDCAAAPNRPKLQVLALRVQSSSPMLCQLTPDLVICLVFSLL